MRVGELPQLRGARILLRAPRPSDVEERVAIGRDPEFRRMVGATAPASGPMTREDAERWYARLVGEPLGWVIEHEGRCVGEARLHGLDPMARRGRLAVGIFAPGDRGRGIGTEAVRLVLAHAFGVLGLRTVALRVLAFNARAIACYRRCSFREVGREAVRLGDVEAEDVLMEATAPGAHELANDPASDEGAPR